MTTDNKLKIEYWGRQGRRTEGGRYEIRHFFTVGKMEFFHHQKEKAEEMAKNYLKEIISASVSLSG